jgi:uncharacterized protein (DUF2336 family)
MSTPSGTAKATAPHHPASIEATSRSRAVLTAKLAEIVGMPATRLSPHERQLAADLLMALLPSAPLGLRQTLAQRLTVMEDPPRALLRYLAMDEISVAGPLLESAVGFDDSDLMGVIRGGYDAHWRMIAQRKHLSELLSDALIQVGQAGLVEIVLSNARARVSQTGIDMAVQTSQQEPRLVGPLLQRPELKPSQALVMFWWATHEQRVSILRRYAAERRMLAAELSDAFREAVSEGWSDPEVRKALQVMERRQRNRAAIEKSPYASLEEAVEMSRQGLTQKVAAEMGYLAGIKPVTMSRILTDTGGEAIGVFCKAVGLKRDHLDVLWMAMRRPRAEPSVTTTPYGRTTYVYDILATAKAQTALRYWNWSFSADAAELTLTTLEEADDALMSAPARRNAALLFGRFNREE